MNGKQSFWATLPGILTGIAAVIAAVATLLVAIGEIKIGDVKEKETATESKTTTLQEAVSVNPGAPVMARPHSAQENVENIQNDAIVAYKKAIELDPKNVQALINLGATYEKLNKYNDAIAAYKRAIKLNPGNKYATRNLSKLQNKTL